MKSLYIISIILLIISFLFLKKTNKPLNIIKESIYAIGLFLCYNTFVVYLFYLLSLKGDIFLYSLSNVLTALFLLIIIIQRKSIQKYKWNLQENLFIFGFAIIIISITFYRFQGFRIIAYESTDASIHYREALKFSEELSLLTKENSKDLIYNHFDKAMSISYINGGFSIFLLKPLKSYQAFTIYDSACFLLCSLLFLVTLLEKNTQNKKKGIFLFGLALFYSLAFALNSYLFGFCYLTLGIMVVNLLFLTVSRFENHWQTHIIDKIGMIFLITFSVFFSYYLFVPSIYLALGIYYIILYHKQELSFPKLLIIGFLTLIVPFFIGFFHFVYPLFITSGNSVLEAIQLPGNTYNNITPLYFFIFFTVYLFWNRKNARTPLDYLSLNLYITTSYICIFCFLFIIRQAELYYFYKLFYIYWIFVILFLKDKLWIYKKYFLIMFLLIGGTVAYIRIFPNNTLSNVLPKLNIYNFNARSFHKNRILFTEQELELVEESMIYKDICEYHQEFPIIGFRLKNYWFYAITDSIPTVNHSPNNHHQFLKNNPSLLHWEYLTNYNCVVYFYEKNTHNYLKENYEILFENEEGAILKRKN